MGKWSNLPLDLLCLIEDYAALYIDKVRHRAVSLDWSSHLLKLPYHRAKQIHFLFHPLENNEEDDATHGLFNPLDKKIYKLYVPELTGKLFRGFFYGWIVATEHIDTGLDEMYLINPITRAQIKLPPRQKFSDGAIFSSEKVDGKLIFQMILDIRSDYEFVRFTDEFTLNEYHMKIVLSSDPNNAECVVIATFGQGNIAWCKCDDKNWTRVHTPGFSRFIDILYSKNYMYALTYEGRVIVFENIGTELEIKFKEITTDRVPISMDRSAYMAECADGSLIVAVRYFVVDKSQEQRLICTKKFKVYKLPSNPNSSWAEVKSIGDDVLFVGFGLVRSIPSTKMAGFKKNHIYFCDFAKPLAADVENGNSKCNKNVKPNVSVFSLEDGTVKPLQGLGDCSWPRPIWTNIG